MPTDRLLADRLRKVPTILLALVVPVVALVTVVITLNVTSDSTGAAAGGGSSGTAISIKNFQFSPNPIVVPVGTAITVTNDDGTAHTLTANDKTFDTSQLDGGAKGSITIKTPGKYAYHCDIHNYMSGTLEAR